ncbi:hypothetical protein BCR33DRAFT_665270 [Rhizoclosmatium globosum]|uniref:Potassium channel domain-containing protein n=1 Tax=Rhizoclosmatium globosum TaxID=329046 RepID=A0A1Y2BEL5_9FUNG|nr:hypothetical protein BCR33DRAFT_665270 [Rhizoclosmatium globosum]|eukprot:ORY33204.1 hypothetical protein BCR33DRAFT_665270 [Rhizoclosmatium globosum]
MFTFQIVEFRSGDKYYTVFDCLVSRLIFNFKYAHVFLQYFVTVTLSTVGYGDISATTTAGKIVVVIIIFSALTLLPLLISPVITSVAERGGDTRQFKRGRADYSVILGQFDTAVQINDLLEGVLHAVSIFSCIQCDVYLFIFPIGGKE